MYESDDAKTFLHSLNPAYEPPNRQALSGRLLDESYDKVKARSDALMTNLDHINISTDESTNINANRIANISVQSKYGALHFISEDVKAKRMTAIAAAEWLYGHLLQISNHRLDRINSIATDTCSVMRRMWTELEKFEGLKHCFFIPCDSHGIQLLVKDIFTVIPIFYEIIRKGQLIVKAFRQAPLQYARLREFQVEHYGQQQSLVLSVITRWGTQYRLVSSLLKSKDSLKHYEQAFRTQPQSERLKNVVMDAIKDRDLWVKLEALRELLQPIDERLRMSESGKSHLGHVLNRWAGILQTMRRKSVEHQELETFISDEGGPFMERYRKQVLPIHIVAYYLMPETTISDIENAFAPIPVDFEKKIMDFFRRYSSSDEEYKKMSREFNFFRTQQSPFESVRQCWEEYKDPNLFWLFARGLAPTLAAIAIRLFASPVNSVASERAFSVQNLIHNKTRNRLLPERANKLAFIYTNARVLDQPNIPTVEGGSAKAANAAKVDGFPSKQLDDLTEKEEVMLEDILMDLDANGELDEDDLGDEFQENEGGDV